MERPTTSLLLPDSQATIHLYTHLVSGDYRGIQSKLLERIKIKLDDADMDEEGLKKKEIGADIAIQDQDITAQFLIKAISLQDGTNVNNIPDFVYNLSIEDGNILFDKVKEISHTSRLSDKDKKK